MFLESMEFVFLCFKYLFLLYIEYLNLVKIVFMFLINIRMYFILDFYKFIRLMLVLFRYDVYFLRIEI